MKENIYLIVLVYILCSCEREQKREYYADGTLRKEWYINKNGRKEGERKQYFHNGQLSSLGYWSNDTLNGELIHYYANGNKRAEWYFKKGKQNGYFTSYYEDGKIYQRSFWIDGYISGEGVTFLPDSLGNGIEKEYFVNFRGKKTSLGWVSYTKNSAIYDESRRVQVTSKRDTINLGEPFEIELELRKPRFKKTEFIIGNYDDKFYLTDSTSLDTIMATDNKAELKFTPKEKGINNIRGYARNYEPVQDSLYQQVNPVYFEKIYFVK